MAFLAAAAQVSTANASLTSASFCPVTPLSDTTATESPVQNRSEDKVGAKRQFFGGNNVRQWRGQRAAASKEFSNGVYCDANVKALEEVEELATVGLPQEDTVTGAVRATELDNELYKLDMEGRLPYDPENTDLEELIRDFSKEYGKSNSLALHRATRIVATVGPRTCRPRHIFRLAVEGVNIFRLNMSHGDRDWHKAVIQTIKTINKVMGWHRAVLLDAGSLDAVRTGDLKMPIPLTKGEEFTFTVRKTVEEEPHVTTLSYDGFIQEIKVGDIMQLTCESGVLNFRVKETTSTDAICVCMEAGTLFTRMEVTLRGVSTVLKTARHRHRLYWDVIDFGIEQEVSFIAISFVKDKGPVVELREYLQHSNSRMRIVSKIENKEALTNIEEIVRVSDGIMVARGDLGASIPLEEVPLAQERVVEVCRNMGRPVIVSTHFLESMTMYPTPTRAEVTDISRAVLQRADAIMLTSETALGMHPFKAIDVLNSVSRRIEKKIAEDVAIQPLPYLNDSVLWGIGEGLVAENICLGACVIANNVNARAIVVFTLSGRLPMLLSRRRPNVPIFAFSRSAELGRRMNLRWGLTPFTIAFHEEDSEETVQTALDVLLDAQLVKHNDRVVIVSDYLVLPRDALSVDEMTDQCHMVQLRTISEEFH